ncbi:MAG TPA: hypothetical protein VK673_21935 [Chthoniobacterales bacterium]|nr:hypothetical protein [Chthoniobacterales bacterium]
MGYTKLFQKILASSIWNEDDKTRLVWVTMLALRNDRNKVEASVGGLAHQARVSVEDCQRALVKLENEDPDDSSGILNGRRVEKVQGGWIIINAEAYKHAQDEDEVRAYHAAYMREWRKRKKGGSVNVGVNGNEESLSDVSDVKTAEQSRTEQSKEERHHVKKGGAGGKEEDFRLNGSEEPNSGRASRKPVVMTMKAIEELKTNPAYEGIDVNKEAWKFKQWCETNKKVASERRFVNWLNKIV